MILITKILKIAQKLFNFSLKKRSIPNTSHKTCRRFLLIISGISLIQYVNQYKSISLLQEIYTPIYSNAKAHWKVIYRHIRTVTTSARGNISRMTSRHEKCRSVFDRTFYQYIYICMYKWTRSLINTFRDRDES